MATTSKQAKVTNSTKYRVAIRSIAVDQGWAFSQISSETDLFTKDGVSIRVHHGPSQLISFAEKADEKGSYDQLVKGAGKKMFKVQSWLTGVADPEHRNYIRLSDEQVAEFESGKGLAMVKVLPKAISEPSKVSKPSEEVKA